jgi:DNA-binding protein YbaB
MLNKQAAQLLENIEKAEQQLRGMQEQIKTASVEPSESGDLGHLSTRIPAKGNAMLDFLFGN